MRQAFAACVAFAVLVVIVVVRFGFRDSPPDVPAQPIADAAIADAPIDAATAVIDAAPAPNKRAAKPRPKRMQTPTPTPTPTPTGPKPTPKPTPEVPTPAIPSPVVPTPGPPGPARPRCTPPPNPAGCPAKEPNVNRPCDADGVRCIYGTSCCPFVYVCNAGVFEAWFQTCP